jgi:CcmD family protein
MLQYLNFLLGKEHSLRKKEDKPLEDLKRFYDKLIFFLFCLITLIIIWNYAPEPFNIDFSIQILVSLGIFSYTYNLNGKVAKLEQEVKDIKEMLLWKKT